MITLNTQLLLSRLNIIKLGLNNDETLVMDKILSKLNSVWNSKLDFLCEYLNVAAVDYISV